MVVLDSSTSAKNKQVSAKKEAKVRKEEEMMTSLRLPLELRKSSQSKKKVTKVGSSSIKKTIKKGQKVSKFSKYCKSTNLTVTPSSNDGQEKWATLVHNGIIFPPPYKASGGEDALQWGASQLNS
ncbi:unnamed protein product [Prunus brigantina]